MTILENWTIVFGGLLVLAPVVIWVLARLRRLIHPKFSLKNEVVLITGAGSGIGRALAFECASHGADIVLTDVRLDSIENVQIELKENFPDCEIWLAELDVSNRSSVQQLTERLARQLSRDGDRFVSVLINNAGIVCGKPIDQLSPTEFARSMRVNAFAPFWLIQAFLPAMRRFNKGTIVGVASIMGMLGGAKLSDYCASKWAHVGLLEALRLELKSSGKVTSGISVITVLPYLVQTGMFRGAFENTEDPMLRKLFFPFLRPTEVARGIVDAIQDGQEFLTLPWHIGYLMPIFRLLPVWLMDGLCGYVGGYHGMDTFRGRGEQWNRQCTNEATIETPPISTSNILQTSDCNLGLLDNSEVLVPPNVPQYIFTPPRPYETAGRLEMRNVQYPRGDSDNVYSETSALNTNTVSNKTCDEAQDTNVAHYSGTQQISNTLEHEINLCTPYHHTAGGDGVDSVGNRFAKDPVSRSVSQMGSVPRNSALKDSDASLRRRVHASSQPPSIQSTGKTEQIYDTL